MRRFVGGDEAAFTELFARLSPAVLGFVVRMLRDRALAEDVVQTTFLSVVRGRGRFEDGQKVRPWVFTIAANAARDALRYRARRPEATTANGRLLDGSTQPNHADPLVIREVESAIAALPEGQRAAVLLHRLSGLGFSEIAEILGVSVSAAKVRAHRGYVRLKELLASCVEET